MDNKDIINIAKGFMSRRYLLTLLVNVTKNEFTILQSTEFLTCLSNAYNGSFLDYDNYMAGTDKHIHPMFVKTYKEMFSRDSLLEAFNNDQELTMQCLYIPMKDKKYHWVTHVATPIKLDSDDIYFVITSVDSDKEKKLEEKYKKFNFNMAIINELISDFVLVHVVDLNTKMSRTIRTREEKIYSEYDAKFKNHFELMNDLLRNHIPSQYVEELKPFSDYSYIKNVFESQEKDRIFVLFKDDRGQDYKISVTKYSEFTSETPLVIFTIRELR